MSKKRRKSKSFLDNEQNRVVVIALEVAALLTIVIVTCAILRGDIIDTFDEPVTKYVLQATTQSAENTEEANHKYNSNDLDLGDFFQNENENAPAGNAENNASGNSNNNNYQNNQSGNKLQSTAGWTTAEIITKARNAVNKTKGYTENLSVHHKESFDATVTECSGGSVVQSVVNLMVGWVVKPVDETLNYQNGYAVNSEDERVPVILPKNGSFTLTPEGVTRASARVSGDEYIININLKSESVGIGEVPAYNASAIGFLDVANFDISFMTVDRADIIYSGSSIELHINSDGYVTYAAYRVPLEIDGAAHRGSISGSAVFVGEQSEIWTLNY